MIQHGSRIGISGHLCLFLGHQPSSLTGLISIISLENEQGANLGFLKALAIGRIIGLLASQPLCHSGPHALLGVRGIALVAGLIVMVFLTRLPADVQGGKGGGDAPSPKEP